MQKEDYLMREIEKTALVLRTILNSLKGKREDLALKQENPFAQTSEMLLNETCFDINLFLTLDEEAAGLYLSQFKGINTGNLEMLAEIIYR